MRRLQATLRFQARCCLDDFLVDGRPIGDLTVSEVRVWIARRERDGRAVARDVRFAKALISGLPGNVVVRDMVKQQDADQYLANAEAEHAQ